MTTDPKSDQIQEERQPNRLPLPRTRLALLAADLRLGVPLWEEHIHTSYTDGKAAVSDIVDQAVRMGLERLVFTEHTEFWRAAHPDWFVSYLEDVRAARGEFGDRIEIVLGLEVPAKSFAGDLDVLPEMLAQAQFVLGTAHRYPGLEGQRVRDLSHTEAVELEHRTLVALTQNPRVQALAHIGGTCGRYCGPLPLDRFRDVVRQATRQGVAVEINARYHQDRLPDILEILIEENAWVTIGSDVHRREDVGAVVRLLQEALR
jgi:histidinol phosphatase-like PHP family hydrolase